MKLTSALIFVLVLSACGGAAPGDAVESLCQGTCARKDRCGTLSAGQDQDACFAACKAEGDKVVAKYRPGFLSDLAACIPGTACDQSEEDCLTQAMTRINPNWRIDPGLQSCEQRAKTCNDTGVGFSDDYCTGLIYLTADTAEVIQQCLTLACGEIKACLRTVLE